MILFGEKVKQSNIWRITLIIGIGIIWRISLGQIAWEGPRNPYVFPVIAFVFLSILLGELSRKIFRLFLKEKLDTGEGNESQDNENKHDVETLNFSIFWSTLALIYVIF